MLEILPPETPRPAKSAPPSATGPTPFSTLPLKPEPDLVSLADLPLAVNDLRDPTLTHLNIQSLRGILIQPATGRKSSFPAPLPARGWPPSTAQSDEANEENLFTLLKAVTTGRAIGFESDAATDFTPWGLHRPFLKLRFLGDDNQGLELRLRHRCQGRLLRQPRSARPPSCAWTHPSSPPSPSAPTNGNLPALVA